MSDSTKARYGTSCSLWKDTVRASRSQKRAWSRRKRIRAQEERSRAKAALRQEIA